MHGARWLFHRTGHPVLRWIYVHAHLPHHRTQRMSDPNHRTLHPFIAIAAIGPHFAGATWFLGRGAWAATLIGFMIGYCLYELMHWIAHGTDLPQRFARFAWVRRKQEIHVSHHFHDPQSDFGFTTSFWDRVFGTTALEP